MGWKARILNILDCGYRLALSAWRAGHQWVMQPVFAELDKKFYPLQVVYSAKVGTDRSGNE